MSAPRVLLIRFSAIGDCVMAVPVASAIRAKHPGAEIVWAIEDRCLDVVDQNRLVDRVHVSSRKRWKQSPGPKVWREQLTFYLGLRRERFDLGLDLQGHSKTALLLRLAQPARRLAADATDALARKLNPLAAGAPRLDLHVVDWNLEVLRQAGIEANAPAWTMPDARNPAPRTSAPRVAISVGAGAPDKLVPVAHWEEVARQLQAEGAEVVFLGGPGDPVPTCPGAIQLVGKISLRESMGAIAASDLHLSADTGNGHIAAAYGVPTVSVFGPMDPSRFRPYGPLARVLRDPSCRPEAVPPTQILEAARACLSARRTTVA